MKNLIKNATEACRTKGHIKITATKEADNIKIMVKDNGKGISKNIIDKLGQKRMTHDKVGGTGLGLYQVKTFLAKHNGKLSIQSKKGIGTEISLTLPYKKSPVTNGPIVIPADYNLLILDDKECIHEVWQQKLIEAENVEQEKVHHFKSEIELRFWAKQNPQQISKSIACFDYDLGEARTGLDALSKFNFAEKYLITGMSSNKSVISKCSRDGVYLVAKELLPKISVKFEYTQADSLPLEAI